MPLLISPLLFFACSGQDDVAAIRELIKKASGLVEEHAVGDIMDMTAEDFLAMPGKLDRRRTKRLLWLVFKKYGKLRVAHPIPSVQVEESRATARFPFLLIKKDRPLPALKDVYEDPQRWVEEIGEKGEVYSMELTLVKTGDGWVVTRAQVDRYF